MPLDPTPVPPQLRGARIALLVTGGIAAYKVVDLASALTQSGCIVRVAMTRSAQQFVGPATFHGVTGQAVLGAMSPVDGAPEPHVFLGDWAQVALVAPATANVIAKIAHGQSDDIVTATILAARCPVVVAPAMNDAMWEKAAVQENLDQLRSRGMTIVEPDSGHLASGHTGAGRLAASGALMGAMAEAMRSRHDMAGRRVVVTAGGTREPIDPVRFISNYSSGKMGYAIASAAAERGATVILVSTASHPQHDGISVHAVETAEEMLAALKEHVKGADLLVMAAAVADFKPAKRVDHKIRREESENLTLELDSIQDLVAAIGKQKDARDVYRVGFAAESSDLESKALEKMKRKGLQAIVANDISRRDIGMGSDFNAGVVLFADGAKHVLDRMPKRDMAERILDLVLPRLSKH